MSDVNGGAAEFEWGDDRPVDDLRFYVTQADAAHATCKKQILAILAGVGSCGATEREMREALHAYHGSPVHSTCSSTCNSLRRKGFVFAKEGACGSMVMRQHTVRGTLGHVLVLREYATPEQVRRFNEFGPQQDLRVTKASLLRQLLQLTGHAWVPAPGTDVERLRVLLSDAMRHLVEWADGGFVDFSDPVGTEQAHADLICRIDTALRGEEGGVMESKPLTQCVLPDPTPLADDDAVVDAGARAIHAGRRASDRYVPAWDDPACWREIYINDARACLRAAEAARKQPGA